MNYQRILLGGLLGGVVFNAFSMVINIVGLGARYEILQKQDVFRVEPRLPFLPLWLLMIFAVSVGLVWLYAAARKQLGPGPKTAIMVGLAVGLIAGLPHPMAGYAWSYQGGFVSLMQAIEFIAGCTLATVAGGWLYKE